MATQETKLLAGVKAPRLKASLKRTHASKAKRAGGLKGVRTFTDGGGSLGLKDVTVINVIEKINQGFPYKFLETFQRATELPMERIAALVRIPPRTLNRRKIQGKLRPDESERLFRASTVVEKATNLFEGNRAAAMQWLRTPQPALAGREPLDFAFTEVGAREVEDLIGRLEHGVFT